VMGNDTLIAGRLFRANHKIYRKNVQFWQLSTGNRFPLGSRRGITSYPLSIQGKTDSRH
jgi:hypothetical protein